MEREDLRVLPLASVGVVKGVWEVFIRPELTAERLAFAGGVALGALAAKSLTQGWEKN